jgi:hypothetical protein
MTDGRRVGHAQRRRIGAPSNMYANTVKPPTHGMGDTVKAKGRYRTGTVTAIFPSVLEPDGVNDGHGYEVTAGKGGRKSMHLSGELMPFQEGQTEAI